MGHYIGLDRNAGDGARAGLACGGVVTGRVTAKDPPYTVAGGYPPGLPGHPDWKPGNEASRLNAERRANGQLAEQLAARNGTSFIEELEKTDPMAAREQLAERNYADLRARLGDPASIRELQLRNRQYDPARDSKPAPRVAHEPHVQQPVWLETQGRVMLAQMVLDSTQSAMTIAAAALGFMFVYGTHAEKLLAENIVGAVEVLRQHK